MNLLGLLLLEHRWDISGGLFRYPGTVLASSACWTVWTFCFHSGIHETLWSPCRYIGTGTVTEVASSPRHIKQAVLWTIGKLALQRKRFSWSWYTWIFLLAQLLILSNDHSQYHTSDKHNCLLKIENWFYIRVLFLLLLLYV